MHDPSTTVGLGAESPLLPMPCPRTTTPRAAVTLEQIFPVPPGSDRVTRNPSAAWKARLSAAASSWTLSHQAPHMVTSSGVLEDWRTQRPLPPAAVKSVQPSDGDTLF